MNDAKPSSSGDNNDHMFPPPETSNTEEKTAEDLDTEDSPPLCCKRVEVEHHLSPPLNPESITALQCIKEEKFGDLTVDCVRQLIFLFMSFLMTCNVTDGL